MAWRNLQEDILTEFAERQRYVDYDARAGLWLENWKAIRQQFDADRRDSPKKLAVIRKAQAAWRARNANYEAGRKRDKAARNAAQRAWRARKREAA